MRIELAISHTWNVATLWDDDDNLVALLDNAVPWPPHPDHDKWKRIAELLKVDYTEREA